MGSWTFRVALLVAFLAVVFSNTGFSQSAEEVEAFLRTAKVVSRKHVGEGINNPLKVLLEKDGIQMQAIFRDVSIERTKMKLVDGTKLFFRDEALFERAAYEMALMLGLDNIPPTVERTISRKKGTLQAWVEDASTQMALDKKKIPRPSQGIEGWRWLMQWQRIHLFDNLIYNEDRGPANILIESNWRLWMIDHTRAFRRWKKLPYPDKIRYCERSVWEKLQTLDDDMMRDRMEGLLNRYEIDGLLERRTLLVEHIQELIDKHGTSDVLFALPAIN